MHDPEVGEQLDGYRLTELLARGGMASVFKAMDVDSGQEVVLDPVHPVRERRRLLPALRA